VDPATEQKEALMRNLVWLALFGCLALAPGDSTAAPAAATSETAPDWSVNATIIEACSCPMFCQCYFNPEPAAHHHEGGKHFCRFNNAFKINRGHFGGVDLAGAKFWVAGDLGAEFSDGEMEWAVLTFDPSVTPEQRNGITAMLGRLYPVQWKSFTTVPDAAIEWTPGTERAHATLGGGQLGEVLLERSSSAMNGGPMTLSNLKYWGAPRNDGFVLMPNVVQAYRTGNQPFEFRGTNGFMITFDIASSD
jgi:hypothetical protein